MANNAAAAAEDGPPLSELEGLQLQINNTTDESLESTRRMKQLCEEAKDSGIKTLVRESFSSLLLLEPRKGRKKSSLINKGKDGNWGHLLLSSSN